MYKKRLWYSENKVLGIPKDAGQNFKKWTQLYVKQQPASK